MQWILLDLAYKAYWLSKAPADPGCGYVSRMLKDLRCFWLSVYIVLSQVHVHRMLIYKKMQIKGLSCISDDISWIVFYGIHPLKW